MTGDRRLNDAIASDMLDRLARDPSLASVHHSVQVTSFGGSGTTALYEYLAREGVDIPGTPGAFPFKHQRTPPTAAATPAGYRVVYIFGDPRDAIVSVFRRGFQGGHYRGMRLAEPSPEVEARLASLDTFLEAGIDDFELADHVRQWRARDPRSYPVLFVRYRDLAREWDAVRDFVGLPTGAPRFEVRPRASSWEALPDASRARIDEMYGALAATLAALPAAEIA